MTSDEADAKAGGIWEAVEYARDDEAAELVLAVERLGYRAGVEECIAYLESIDAGKGPGPITQMAAALLRHWAYPTPVVDPPS